MSNIVAIMFAVLAGLSTTLEAFFNGELEKSTSALIATFISLVIGALFFLLSILVTGNFKDLLRIEKLNPILLLGGIFGGLIIYFTVKAIPTLGVSNTLIVIVISQVLLGFVIDSLVFGKTPIQLYNCIGVALIFIGVFFIIN